MCSRSLSDSISSHHTSRSKPSVPLLGPTRFSRTKRFGAGDTSGPHQIGSPVPNGWVPSTRSSFICRTRQISINVSNGLGVGWRRPLILPQGLGQILGHEVKDTTPRRSRRTRHILDGRLFVVADLVGLAHSQNSYLVCFLST